MNICNVLSMVVSYWTCFLLDDQWSVSTEDKRNKRNEIKDVAVTSNNLLAHMRSHTTATVLRHVELYSLLVIPTIEHANEAV